MLVTMSAGLRVCPKAISATVRSRFAFTARKEERSSGLSTSHPLALPRCGPRPVARFRAAAERVEVQLRRVANVPRTAGTVPATFSSSLPLAVSVSSANARSAKVMDCLPFIASVVFRSMRFGVAGAAGLPARPAKQFRQVGDGDLQRSSSSMAVVALLLAVPAKLMLPEGAKDRASLCAFRIEQAFQFVDVHMRFDHFVLVTHLPVELPAAWSHRHRRW